jgi:DNA-binding HxlR family transcriptional regulator
MPTALTAQNGQKRLRYVENAEQVHLQLVAKFSSPAQNVSPAPFSEFEEHLGIASNILSNRLDRLVHLGVLFAGPASDQRSRLVYRLTEKGHDLYSVPLALLTWGERWLACGENLTKLTHTPCRHRLRAIFGCASCGLPANLDDLAFETSSTI